MSSIIDDIMGFNPADMSAFQEKGPKQDPNIYRTNPCKQSKSDDGHYRAKIKLLLNPFNIKESIIPAETYWLDSLDGSRQVRSSLSNGDTNCPIFKAWKRLWYAGDDDSEERNKSRDRARSIFNKTPSQWVLVQILEDENQPELVGQFRVMKLARDIREKLEALMNPSTGSKKRPYPVMDYVVGLALELDVAPGPDDPTSPERKQREISYSLCTFGDYAPVIQTDGSQLLTEEELELVDSYVTAYKDAESGKTETKKKAGAKLLEELRPKLRPIYEKAINYVTENVKNVENGKKLDVKEHCGYTPWDEKTAQFVDRFIEIVDAGLNPRNISYEHFMRDKAMGKKVDTENVEPAVQDPEEDGDLPF